MVSLYFYLHDFRKPEDRKPSDQVSIYLRLSPGGLAVATGEKVTRSSWNHKSQRVSGKEKYYSEINARLQDIQNRLELEYRTVVASEERWTRTDVLQRLRPSAAAQKSGTKQRQRMGLQEHYEDWKRRYLAKKNRGLTFTRETDKQGYQYARKQKQAVDWLLKFKPTAKVKDLTEAFWFGTEKSEGYEDYLYETADLQDVTVNEHRKYAIMALKDADLDHSWLKQNGAKSQQKIPLDWEEVQQLYHFKEYSSEQVRQSVMAWLANVVLCLRWSDLSKNVEEKIVEVRVKGKLTPCVQLYQGKTSLPVYLPVVGIAEKVMQEFGRIPIPRTPSGLADDSLFRQYVKQGAREAGLTRKVMRATQKNEVITTKYVPICETISPHLARHTGSTLIRKATKSDNLASLLLGHVEAGNTAIYVYKDPSDIAEAIAEGWAHYKI